MSDNSIETIIGITQIRHCSDEGFAIITTKQTIKLTIDMGQSCCETPGYLITNDDTEEFIGAMIEGIAVVDTELKTKKFDRIQEIKQYLDGGAMIFVNIETGIGTLQFTAYNQHNGYYGSRVKIESTQLNHKDVL